MTKEQELLGKYIPENAVNDVVEMIKEHKIHLKIVNKRVTKHGDYRKNPSGIHQITVNASLNKYRFFITLIHEIAHKVAIETYGNKILPHGIEWKRTFQKLMVPFINPSVFPSETLGVIANHFKNPTASSDTDLLLNKTLKVYDANYEEVTTVSDLALGNIFSLPNGRLFQKNALRVKRFECTEIATNKKYLFHPNAEVKFIK
jgi:SprT protein